MTVDTSDSQGVDRVVWKTALEGQLGTTQHSYLDQKKLASALLALVAVASEWIQDDHCTLPTLWDQQNHYQMQQEHGCPMRCQGWSANSEEKKGFLVAMKSQWG